jgi:hypothetical protein
VIVLTFKPRLRPKVLDRTKLNTMRANRKRPVKVGDVLSLRGWSGRPYMTPQIRLMDVICTRVTGVVVDETFVRTCDGEEIHNLPGLHAFAVRDGFANWEGLIAYFRDQGPLPFVGTLIGRAP